MFYFLLDVCSINSDLNDLNITDQFAKAFGMAENLTKLIKAFWFLDHKDFEVMSSTCDLNACEMIVIFRWSECDSVCCFRML